MTAEIAIWTALMACALVGGGAVAGALAAPKTLEPLVALLFLGCSAGAAYSAIAIARVNAADEAPLYAAAFAVAAAAGGYALASSLMLEMARFGRRPARSARPSTPPAARAVVIVCCSEPSRYSVSDTAALLADLDAEGRLDASLAALPLLFFAQKARYAAIGGKSPAAAQLKAIADSVEVALGEGAAHVLWASCSGPGRAAARVSEAIEAGHTSIVVVDLSVAPSPRATAALAEVESIATPSEAHVVRADPLGTDCELPQALAARIRAAVTTPSATGVVLVGHGQTEEEARRDPAFVHAETVFLNRIRMSLVEDGIPEHNVKLAWAEWSQPDVTSTVRHFAALGCERIVVVPAVHPVDTLATRLDLEIAVRQARVDESVSAVVLPTWRDEPELIRVIARAVEKAWREEG